jgi:hypothetical protein
VTTEKIPQAALDAFRAMTPQQRKAAVDAAERRARMRSDYDPNIGPTEREYDECLREWDRDLDYLRDDDEEREDDDDDPDLD